MSGQGAPPSGIHTAELAERLAASAAQAARLAQQILLDLRSHEAALARIWQQPAGGSAGRRAGQGA